MHGCIVPIYFLMTLNSPFSLMTLNSPFLLKCSHHQNSDDSRLEMAGVLLLVLVVIGACPHPCIYPCVCLAVVMAPLGMLLSLSSEL